VDEKAEVRPAMLAGSLMLFIGNEGPGCCPGVNTNYYTSYQEVWRSWTNKKAKTYHQVKNVPFYDVDGFSTIFRLRSAVQFKNDCPKKMEEP
jgi:hypothetical protein